MTKQKNDTDAVLCNECGAEVIDYNDVYPSFWHYSGESFCKDHRLKEEEAEDTSQILLKKYHASGDDMAVLRKAVYGENRYKVYQGTAYHENTPDDVVLLLESLRESSTRIVLDSGDTETGKSWNEKYNISGYIGRSNGEIKVPLLIHNSRSLGGGSILDHCIIGIYMSQGKFPLYQLKK